jgi:hypothetical protein
MTSRKKVILGGAVVILGGAVKRDLSVYDVIDDVE